MPIQSSTPQRLPAYVSASRSRPAIHFGALTLHPTERRLECDGQALRISSRAFDILLALLEQPGEVVSHRILMARAWPGTNVEEANLRVHVAGLRKLLDCTTGTSHAIINVPGRGYAITGPVGSAAPASADTQAAARSFYSAMERSIGRDKNLALLAALVQSERLTALAGAGGIRKTALAVQLLDLVGELTDVPLSLDGALGRR
jgi:DNA-binding winged helix-turn-helix (wHTH) protein